MKNDLYIETGKILELIQFWEEELRKLTIKYNIQESDDKRSLSNMNSFLLKSNVITNDEYLCIKKVIEIRNIIIHRLFLELNNETLNKINSMKEVINTSLKIFKTK